MDHLNEKAVSSVETIKNKGKKGVIQSIQKYFARLPVKEHMVKTYLHRNKQSAGGRDSSR
jgi:hypothetical protein